MKEWIAKNFMKIWISGLVGMGFGLLIEMFVGIWYKPSVNSLLMLAIIIGGGIGAWYILTNNKNFGKF